uniref:EF-hand domain-containing protein n=1 Tax=Tanacetum cinerariifolium TaxID=118510 RepID=A0A699H3K2_TANCI|nr:hypothetical protein [Tanacetum cinerariifolium]
MIFAVPEYKTTWGSTTFKDQVLETEAWAYQRLKSAGAVLVGKLLHLLVLLPALELVWFLSPAGSITYPAARCGVTALRPTFGAVGRTGVLRLSESLDKFIDPDDFSSRNIFLDDPFSVDITKLTLMGRNYLVCEFDVVCIQDLLICNCQQSQSARGKLIQQVWESFTVDAFVGGSLVGMPVMVVPVGFEKIQDPPTNETRSIYAPPDDHDHIAETDRDGSIDYNENMGDEVNIISEFDANDVGEITYEELCDMIREAKVQKTGHVHTIVSEYF